MAIIFDVGFKLNSADFQQQFGTLTDIISQDIARAFNNSSIKGLSKEVSAAVTQANMFEKAMRNATTNKGLSFATLNAELKQMGTSAEKVVATLAMAGPSFSKSFTAVTASLAGANREAAAISAKVTEMKRVMTQSLKFTIANQFYQEVAQAFSAAIQWSKDLNEELTKIQVVTGKVASEMDKVYESTIKGSRELRVAASDYAEASLIYYQQGLGDAEVEQRTNTTIKAAKAAGQSVQTMSAQLTAIWNTYRMGTSELERTASIGARLAADTAVDFKDIAEGMQISATAASQMGVSYESLAAIIATVGDTTQQSASIIGNAYKTIFSRFYNLKSTGEDAGVSLGLISSQLKEMGVNILDANGELIQLDDIIMDLGNRWDTYSQKQQIAIAEIVGGTRQYGQFLALMQNFDKYQSLLGKAQSENISSLEQQYEDSLNSVESAATNASEAWSSAFSQLIDADTIKTVYQISEGLGNAFGEVIKGAGGVENILLIVLSILTRKLIPETTKWASVLITTFKNRSLQSRENEINKSYNTMIGYVDAESRQQKERVKQKDNTWVGSSSNSVTAAEQKIDANTNFAKQRLQIYKESALAQNQLNELIKRGSAEEKVMAESKKQLISLAANEAQEEQGKLNLLNQQILREKEIADLKIKNQNARLSRQNVGLDATAGQADSMLSHINNNPQQEFSSQDMKNLAGKMDQMPSGMGQSLQALMTDYNNLIKIIKTGSQEEKTAAQQRLKDIQKEILAIREKAKAQIQQNQYQKKYNENMSDFYKSYSDMISMDMTGEENIGKMTESLEGMGQALKNIVDEDSANIIDDILGNTSQIDSLDEIIIRFNGLTGSLGELRGQNGQPIFSQQDIQSLQAGEMSLEQVIDRIRTLRGAADDLRLRMGQGFNIDPSKAITALGQIAGSLMTVYAGVNSIVDAVFNFQEAMSNDSDTDYLDAVMSGVMGLSMLIPGVISLFLGLQAAVKAFGASAAAVQAKAPWLLAISAIAVGIIAIISAVNKAKEKQIEKAKETAKASQEETKKLSELNKTLKENSDLVKENYIAWKTALQTGEEVETTYEKLRISILNLNNSISQTTESALKLTDAMSQALVTGNFENYYDELEKVFEENVERTLNAGKQAISDSWAAYTTEHGRKYKTEVIQSQTQQTNYNNPNNYRSATAYGGQSNNATNAHRYGTSYGGQSNTNQTRQVEVEPYIPQQTIVATKGTIVAKLNKELNQDENKINFTIDEINSEGEFVSAYEDLVAYKEQLLSLNAKDKDDQEAIKKALDSVNSKLETMKETYEAITEQQQIMIDQVNELGTKTIQAQADSFNNNNFSENADYVRNLGNQLQQQFGGILTDAQIDQLFTSITSSNPDLARTVELLQQIDEIQVNLNGDDAMRRAREKKSLQDQADYYEKSKEQATNYKDDLVQIKDDIINTTELELSFFDPKKDKKVASDEYQNRLANLGIEKGTITTFAELNNLISETDKEITKLGESSEKTNKELENYGDVDLSSLQKQQQDFENFYNTLTNQEQEMLLEVGVDFVDSPEDLQKKLDEYYKVLNLKVSLRIYSDDELKEQFKGYQELQDLMGGIIDQYQEYGEISVDNAYQLIESGHPEYVTKVGDAYKLTNEALKDFNESVIGQDQIVEDLLKGIDKTKEPVLGLMTSMGQLYAVMGDTDNAELKNFFGETTEEAADFVQQIDITTDSVLDFYKALETKIDSTFNEDFVANLTDKELEMSMTGLSEMGNQVAYSMNAITDAAEQGKISREDYFNSWEQMIGVYDSIAEKGKIISKQKIQTIFTDSNITKDSEAWKEAMDALDTKDLEKFNKVIDKNKDSLGDNAEEAKKLAETYLTCEESAKAFAESVNNIDISRSMEEEIKKAEPLLDEIFNEDYSFNIDANVNFDANTTLAQLKTLNSGVYGQLNTLATNVVNAIMGMEGEVGQSAKNLLVTLGANATDVMNGTLDVQDFVGNLTVGNLGKVINATNSMTVESMGKSEEAIDAMLNSFADTVDAFDYTINIAPSGSIKFNSGNLLDKIGGLLSGNQEITFDPSGSISLHITGSGTKGSLDLSAAKNFLNDPVNPEDLDLGAAVPDLFLDDDSPNGDNDSSGGGEDFQPEELIEAAEKFVERYEDITKSIERQEDALDNLSKAMESAYGAKRLKMMDSYNTKIQRLAKTQKEYIKEAQKYFKQDKEAFLKSSPDIQKIAKFEPGEYGGISNPEAVRRHLEEQAILAAKEYNAVVKQYNAAGNTSDLAKERLDKAREKYDKTIEELNRQNALLDQLEETETTLMEAINQQVEYIKEWLQNKIDQAVYKMEVHIAINDFDIEYLDVLKEAFGEIGIVGGQSFEFINSQLRKMSDNVDKTTEEVDRLFEIANNIKDPANQDYFMSLFGSPEEGILAWKEFIGTGQIPQEILDELNNSRDQLLDYYQSTLDYLDELWQNYIDQISYYLDEFEALTNRLKSRQDITESLLDSIEASGLDHKWGADTNSSQYKLMETSMKNIAYQARAAKESFEVANTKAQEMKKELDNILGGRQLSELSEDEAFRYNRIKEAYDELQSQANELEETMYSSITEALERAKEYAEVWGQQIAHSWSEDLGGVFDDLSDAMELYDQKQNIADFFLDDYDKIYELKKLSREIEKEMENISDPETLNRYNNLLDEINAKKEDGSKMTQTELDILRAQFELEQAQAAFEDAQNAKNTMRLARDASGNWNYVYSSDNSEAEDKQQAVEDSLANIHRMHREAADEMGELWLQTQQELYEYEQTIDWQMYDNDEKYRQMVDTRRNYYKQQMDQYAQYFIYHNEAIGRNQSNTTLGIIGNITNMATANEQYKQNHDKLVEDLRNNFNKWMGDADLTRQEVGGDYDSLEDMVNEKTTEMINENDALGDAIENLAYETGIWLEQSRDYTADWSQQVVDYYENVISKIKEYLELIQAANSEAANDFTGFNAQRDYTASIQNYAQEFINNRGTVDELMKDETYLQMGKELANKIADSELNANDHWVADMDAMTDDGLGYLEQIANNTKPNKDYVKKDEFDESWQAADRGDSGSLLPGVSGTSRPKPTASGGLIKTPQVRSLAEEGPELVLNKDDTQNILEAVKNMRETIKLKISAMNSSIGQKVQGETIATQSNVETIEQNVKIDATFPGVSVASEIEEALNNLINQAVQYAHKNNR